MTRKCPNCHTEYTCYSTLREVWRCPKCFTEITKDCEVKEDSKCQI